MTPQVERVTKGGGNDITWFVATHRTNLLCGLGVHGLRKQLRADGWLTFTHIRRFRCLCGKWEWVEYNGSIVERQKAPTPQEDQRMLDMQAHIDVLVEKEHERIRPHIPYCFGFPGNCQSCGCNRPIGAHCPSHPGVLS